MRTIAKLPRFAARAPSPPIVKRIPAHAIAAAQLRYAPMARVIVQKHTNPLFHPTGLLKRHRKSYFRTVFTCRPSTRSKLSGFYPVHTLARPPTPTRPHKGGGSALSGQEFGARLDRGHKRSVSPPG